MRKLVLIMLCMSAFTISNMVNGQIPTNGLIAYYPFSGNATDQSGNSNDGTVQGAILTTDRFGDSNRAYLFNGSSSYIEVPNSSTLQSPNTEFTISAWVQITDLSVLNWILDKRINVGFAPYSSYGLFTANSEWRTGISTSNGLFSAGKTAIVTNTWIHLLSLYTGSKIYLYVNGVALDSNSASGNILYSTLPLYIGKSPNNAAYTAGKIDDIRIYDRALNATEIGQLYNEPQNTTSLRETNKIHFNVYPNPSFGSVNIDINESELSSEYQVTVTNVMGQAVYTGAHNGNTTLEMKDLTDPGIYFITLTDHAGKLNHTEKVLIH